MQGTYKLIEILRLKDFNTAEKASVLADFLNLLESAKEAGGEALLPSAAEEGGVAALNIPAGQVRRLREIYDDLIKGMGGNAFSQTPRLNEVDHDRNRVATFILDEIRTMSKMPFKEKREAAKRLLPFLRPFKGFRRKPLGQKTIILEGLVDFLRSPEHADDIRTLDLVRRADQLEQTNQIYRQLIHERSKIRSDRRQAPNTVKLTAEAQTLLADMCHEANATAVLRPSKTTAWFISNVRTLFDMARTEWKSRDKRPKRKARQRITPKD